MSLLGKKKVINPTLFNGRLYSKLHMRMQAPSMQRWKRMLKAKVLRYSPYNMTLKPSMLVRRKLRSLWKTYLNLFKQ